MEDKTPTLAENQIKCKQCGAILTYKPGTRVLKCEYCGYENEIEIQTISIDSVKIDYEEYLQSKKQVKDETLTQEARVVRCQACGAQIQVEPNTVSTECPFCGTQIVIKDSVNEKLLKPAGLIPFKIDKKEAVNKFHNWIKGKWFAPSKLKKYAKVSGKIQGIYLPFWSYDANTTTSYTGERGIEYQVEVEDTDSEGKTITRTETRVRWEPVSGVVNMSFKNILVGAYDDKDLKISRRPSNWHVDEIVPFEEKFLSGFKARVYDKDVDECFDDAKSTMDFRIENEIRRQIGGDRQRIHSKNTTYKDIMFAYILLPLWISSYRFKDKVYHFYVNGQTGEVNGEYPKDWLKIVLVILIVLIVIGLLYLLAN